MVEPNQPTSFNLYIWNKNQDTKEDIKKSETTSVCQSVRPKSFKKKKLASGFDPPLKKTGLVS